MPFSQIYRPVDASNAPPSTNKTVSQFVSPPVSGLNKVPTYLPPPVINSASTSTIRSTSTSIRSQGSQSSKPFIKVNEEKKLSHWLGMMIAGYVIVLAVAWKLNKPIRLFGSGGSLGKSILGKGYLAKSVISLRPSKYTLSSPWVVGSNASWVVNQRMNQMEIDYSNALNSNGWKVLRATKNVTIDTLSMVRNEWPVYIRSVAVFNVSPDKLRKLFQSENYQISANKKSDDSNGYTELLATSGNVKIIRKVRTISYFLLLKLYQCRIISRVSYIS